MNSGQLSQDEIDALLKGDSGDSGNSSASGANAGPMSQEEIDDFMSGSSPDAGEASPGPMSQAEIDALMGGGGSSSASDLASSGPMSQAEIDTLMGAPAGDANGMDTLMASLDSAVNPDLPQLTDIEADAMGEIGNMSMGTAATTLAVLVGKRVSITTPKVSVTTFLEMKKKYPLPCLVVEVGYTSGILGTNLLTIQEKDARIIANLMMGGDGLNPPPELDEICMSAVAEAMNQMMGSTATSISTIFKKKVDIAPPKVSLVDFATADNITSVITNEDPVVRVSFRMEVEDLIDSDITQIIPFDVAQNMVENLMEAVSEIPQSNQAPAAPRTVAAPPPPPQPAAVPPPPPGYTPPPSYASPPGYAPPPPAYSQHAAGVPVQPAQFQQLTPGAMNMENSNIGLIMDVPLQVTVELGRTKKLIREILDFSPGSVVPLDKLAGEPVDVLVNGKLIAKGEVVVIDENFGVRITSISTQAERMSTLQ